jgi:hypothetical protein
MKKIFGFTLIENMYDDRCVVAGRQMSVAATGRAGAINYDMAFT